MSGHGVPMPGIPESMERETKRNETEWSTCSSNTHALPVQLATSCVCEAS